MAHPFKTVDNPNGTRTYYLFASDIERGIDVITYTYLPNPIGAPPPAQTTGTVQAAGLDPIGLVLFAVAGIPAATRYRRRRRVGA